MRGVMRRLVVGAGALLCGLGMVAPSVALAQVDDARAVRDEDVWSPGVYMRQAIDKAMTSAGALANQYRVGLRTDGACFLATPLAVGGKASINVEMKAGRLYVLIGAGDSDVRDLDLRVKSVNGATLGKDELTDSVPVVIFTPERDGMYTLELELFAADAPSFCALTILEAGVDAHPLSSINACRDKIIAAGESIARQGRKAGFLVRENRWALIGAIMSEGESQTLTNITTSGGLHAFIAVGDSNARDIDLEVTRSSGGKLGEDTDMDANPVVLDNLEAGRAYDMKVLVPTAARPALVMAATFQIE